MAVKQVKMKLKAKEWIALHKEDIQLGACVVGYAIICLGTGAIIGGSIVHNKYADKTYITNDKVRDILLDVQNKYNKSLMFAGVAKDGGFIPSELGKIGEEMLELGGDVNQKFTHFIAFGNGN